MKIMIDLDYDSIDEIIVAQLKEQISYINGLIIDGQDPDHPEHRELESHKAIVAGLKIALEYFRVP